MCTPTDLYTCTTVVPSCVHNTLLATRYYMYPGKKIYVLYV